MKVMLVCGAGMSTSILMNKMLKYAKENGIDLQAMAYGFTEAPDHLEEFDCIMIGPQAAYRIEEIRKQTDKPCAVIKSIDYGMGNAANVIKAAQELIGV
ncbi:PTS sugar transporter subunit IIB [Allofournierella sp.]|uniref:PTS sugar transporter subunit IIB n=1 Tax=Allofournierella sp. TaxID=1940256 RepID=UPI003AF1C7E6